LKAAFHWLNVLSAQDKIALTAAVVSVLVGIVSLSQALSSRRQVKIAIKQTEAANEQARQAKRQGDLTEQQIKLLKEQMSSDRLRAAAEEDAAREARTVALAVRYEDALKPLLAYCEIRIREAMKSIYHNEPNLYTSEFGDLHRSVLLENRNLVENLPFYHPLALTVRMVDKGLSDYLDSVRIAIRGWSEHYETSSDPLYLKRMHLRPWAAQRDAFKEYKINAAVLNIHLKSLAQKTCNPDPPRVPLDRLD
jgi:hypothetical protein